jgi:hypothetical protein
VAALATTYIPASFLERIETPEHQQAQEQQQTP